MPRIRNGKDPNLCNEDDCNQPRFSTEKQRYSKCETHMRALWRKYSHESGDQAPVGHESPAAVFDLCPLCRRTLQQAALAALYRNVWCSACTPISTPQADLKRRLKPRESSSYDAQKLRSQRPTGVVSAAEPRDQLQSDLAEARRQIDALRQTIAQTNDLQVSDSDHQIVIVDYSQNCLHYLVCSQSSVQPMLSTERDLLEQLKRDAADGFLVTHTPQMEIALP